MTTTQKIIKYFAVAFAVFLIVCIIAGVIAVIARIPALSGKQKDAKAMQSYSVTGSVENLTIEVGAAKLSIKTGDAFSVESNYKGLKVENKNGTLTVEEKDWFFDLFFRDAEIYITVPQAFLFETVSVKNGAGELKFETLSAKELSLNLGAGKTEIRNLTVEEKAEINGGAGELRIDEGSVANLDFNMGIGEATLKSRLTGDCKIDYGVGELNLTLLGDKADYRILAEKGIGQILFDGKEMQDDFTYGDGSQKISVSGGIGELKLEFDR